MIEIARLWRGQKERYKDLGTGKIYAYTDNIALIELPDGKKVTAQLTDFDHTPEIGESVKCVTRKLFEQGEDGMIVYGYKFRPFLPREASMSSK